MFWAKLNFLQNVNEKKKQIVFGPIFPLFQPCINLTRILIFALRKKLRKDIVPIYCDGVQEIECNVYGGLWGGGKKFKKNCKICQNKTLDFWNSMNLKPLKFSSFINKSELNQMSKNFKKIDQSDLNQKYFKSKYNYFLNLSKITSA